MSKFGKFIPNMLTLSRIIAVPFILLVYIGIEPPMNHLWVTLIFAVAALTDWMDGYLARRQQSSSALGAFLDPVADKLLVTAALIIILIDNPRTIIMLCSIIIISREITVSALREWMATIGKGKQMYVRELAKVKTTIQMLGIGLLLSHLNYMTFLAGTVALIFATLLTLYSMIQYLQIAAEDLTFFSEQT